MNKINKYFSILFCGILILFSVINIIAPTKEFSETENRYLAKFPAFSVEDLKDGSFGEKVDKFSSDQFLFRDTWVKLKANFEKLIGKKENNGVYFCENDYLIEVLPEYNEKIIEGNLNAIKKLGRDGKYNASFLLVPTAYEINKDFLPNYAYKDIQLQIMEKCEGSLKESGVNFINPTEYLKSVKDEYLYYRTDHHQTAYGSHRTYEHLMNALNIKPYPKESFNISTVSDSFYGTTWSKAPICVKADEIIKFELKAPTEVTVEYIDTGITTDSLYNEKRLKDKDKYPYYLDGNHSIVKINTSIKNGKSVAVFKDSYAHSIIPFLANHYENIHVIDLRYYNFNTKEYMDEKQIKDVLVIYNTTNFMTDNNLVKLGAYLK